MRVIRSRKSVVVLACELVALAAAAHAQTTPEWIQIAGYSVNEGLAGPASGPVRSVWYAAGGYRLLAQTESGRVFETVDFQHWKLNSDGVLPPLQPKPGAKAGPESGIQFASSGERRYSLTRENVYGSDDGRQWVNLTGFQGRSIVGDGFAALAVSPSNPLDIAAANQFGVWRSLDGGLSWQGVNDNLPNLAARSLAGQRTVALATAASPGATLASASAGKWALVEGKAPETALDADLAARTGIEVSAAARAGTTIYAGRPDGHVLVSADDGTTWPTESALPDAGSIARIWVDPANGQSALAASGARLYRTTNGGKFWDEVTGALNAGAVHGIAADSSAGVVYLATDRGVFSGRLSLIAADLAPATWSSVSRDLPIATAWDARLNPDGTLTVLLDGYGVFETPAPHRALAPRIVNGADMTDRAAAPGSLISVIGANVRQASSGRYVYPVLLPSDRSSQLQVPFEIAPGTLQLALESDGNLWMAPLNVKQASPAIFVDPDGTPMIQDSASGLVIDAGTPLRAGAVIQVLATGLGRVTPEWPTGVPAPVDSPPAVAATVTAYLDGTPIRVTRATLAPTLVGTYLVELEIPSIVNRGASELRIVADGEESNRVKLYLEPFATVQ
jgi:uncharacterized protein (TIGR03437 family)